MSRRSAAATAVSLVLAAVAILGAESTRAADPAAVGASVRPAGAVQAGPARPDVADAAAAPASVAPGRPDARRSGFAFMSPSTQAMQREDALNPAFLWVADGAALWDRETGAARRACAACHGDAASSMRGVAARYPAFDARAGRPVDLAGRINLCRERHQGAAALAPEAADLLALESHVALQSRGQPIAPPSDARLEPYQRRGAARYAQRIGQLDFSCAQCHDDHAGRRLAGSLIPQAHPTGYPLYRLEWQGLGSLQRRLRGCMTGVRAQPHAYGAIELIELQLYLAQRAAGLVLDAPAVRP